MATLLNVKLEDMDELANSTKRHTQSHQDAVCLQRPIFSRSLIRVRGRATSQSIFNAVVSQTVAGLAQGREIEGQIVYLGGPLTFMSELRNCFDRSEQRAFCPENSLYYVACGAASCAEKTIDFDEVIEKVKKNYRGSGNCV